VNNFKQKRLNLLVNEDTLNVKITSSTYEGLDSPIFDLSQDDLEHQIKKKEKKLTTLNSDLHIGNNFQNVRMQDNNIQNMKENYSIYSNLDNDKQNKKKLPKYSYDGPRDQRTNSQIRNNKKQARESASVEDLTQKGRKNAFYPSQLLNKKSIPISRGERDLKKRENSDKKSIRRAQMQLSSNDKIFQNRFFDSICMNSPMTASKEYGDIFTESDYSSPMKEIKFCEFNFVEKKKNLSDI
jgi:hypothetical protein